MVESELHATRDLKSFNARELTQICVILNDYPSPVILLISATVSPSIVSCSALPCSTTRPLWAIPQARLLIRAFTVVEHQMVGGRPAAVGLYA
jgi:hypothetical protein